MRCPGEGRRGQPGLRSEEHTSELQSHLNLVCRLLLEKKKNHSASNGHVHHNFLALLRIIKVDTNDLITVVPCRQRSRVVSSMALECQHINRRTATTT